MEHKEIPGTQMTSADRGQRRPSLVNLQKQHTIEDEEDFDEKTKLISPVKKSSKLSPDGEYCDTLGLFSGLRQDYAWCEGRICIQWIIHLTRRPIL